MFAYCNNSPVVSIDTNGGVPTCCVMVHDGGGVSIPDVTEQLMNLMREHVRELRSYYFRCLEEKKYVSSIMLGDNGSLLSQENEVEAYFETMEFFRTKETDGGDWDIKQTQEYHFTRSFVFNGEVYSGQQLGNIHYGYVGSSMYTPLILHSAAGLNQVKKGIHWEYMSTFFDEPDDYDMITYGINLYGEG